MQVSVNRTNVRWLGPAATAAAVGVAALYLARPTMGEAAAGVIFGAALLIVAIARPEALFVALGLAVPFNYGVTFGGASIKLVEWVAGLMIGVIFVRLAAGDGELRERLGRAATPVAALGALGLMAVVTAAPHPNFFNVRYELEAYVACVYALLFFRARHWPLLVGLCFAMLAVESLAALGLRFGLGVAGVSFFEPGGAALIRFSEAELREVGGGAYRLAGTLGHKNLLAAFYGLLLPLAGLEMLRRPRVGGLIVFAASLAVVALTDSVTGWGALALVALLALIHLRRFDRVLAAVLVGVPLSALTLWKFGSTILSRIEQIMPGGEGWGTVAARGRMLEISRELILSHPWTGIGRLNYLEYGETYFAHAHNLYLMKIIEMGIPAGIAFIVFLAAAMAWAWRPIGLGAKTLARDGKYYRVLGVWLGCAGFLAMNLFDYNYADFGLGPLFMALMGVALVEALDHENIKPPRRGDAEHSG